MHMYIFLNADYTYKKIEDVLWFGFCTFCVNDIFCILHFQQMVGFENYLNSQISVFIINLYWWVVISNDVI